MHNQRNIAIDNLKIILAFLVIGIHVFPSVGIIGSEVYIYRFIANGLSRIAVPLFFLISGYFLGNSISTEKFGKYLKRIITLFVAWQIIYTPLYLSEHLGIDFSIKWALHTSIFGIWHLWYLNALIIGVVILYYLQQKISNKKIIALMALSMYILGYILQILYIKNYMGQFSVIYELISTSRNGLFFGFPMLYLGSVYSRWQSINKNKSLFVIATLVFICEVLIYNFDYTGSTDLYISLPVLCMCIFAYVQTKNKPWFNHTDKSLSIGIYLIHPYMVVFLRNFDLIKDNYFLNYLFCLPITIGLWYLLEKLNNRIKFLF